MELSGRSSSKAGKALCCLISSWPASQLPWMNRHWIFFTNYWLRQLASQLEHCWTTQLPEVASPPGQMELEDTLHRVGGRLVVSVLSFPTGDMGGSGKTSLHSAELAWGEGQCCRHVASPLTLLMQSVFVSEMQGATSASPLCSRILSAVSCSWIVVVVLLVRRSKIRYDLCHHLDNVTLSWCESVWKAGSALESDLASFGGVDLIYG